MIDNRLTLVFDIVWLRHLFGKKEIYMKIIDTCLLYCVAAAFVRLKELSMEIIIYLGRVNYRRRTICVI